MRARYKNRTAFTLIELLVVIAVIALIISILLPALAKSRKTARITICTSNMRQSSVALVQYASDWKGAMGSFSWKPQTSRSRWADLNGAYDYQTSHANQAVDIARRLTGHDNDGFYPPFDSRIVDRHWSQLPLIDGGYFSQKIPEPTAACPDDRDTIVWQRNFNAPNTGLDLTGDPEPTSPLGFKRILPFWTTYQFVPTAWTPDDGPYVLSQASGGPGNHFLYNDGVAAQHGFGGRMHHDVMFPSQKVSNFDLWDRHMYRRMIWHSYPVAAQPLSFFDGSVSMRRTKDCNPGWNPLSPTLMFPTTYEYWPIGTDPPTLSGAAHETVTGYFRWTRWGIRGIDFGGNEPRWRP